MAAVTYTVKPGDSLWKIAKAQSSAISGNTTQAKVNTLVALNGLEANPNLIYAGQVLKLSDTAGGDDTSSSSTTSPPNSVVIKSLGLKSDSTTGRDIFAMWTWHKMSDNFDKFDIRWECDVTDSSNPNGYYTYAKTSNTTDTWSVCDIEDEILKKANWVQIFIKPIAKQKNTCYNMAYCE